MATLYKSVDGRDDPDREADGSDTDVGDSLIGGCDGSCRDGAGEKPRPWTGGRQPPPGGAVARALATLRRHRWAVDTALLAAVLGLLVVVLVQQQRQLGGGPARWQVGGDYTAAGPVFDTRVVKWEADEAFVPAGDRAFVSNATKAVWNTLMPAGTGWRHTESETTFFTTTMTHQLHCIYMMGRIYTALRTGDAALAADLPEDYHSHFLHCIDYVRQAAMCAGDVAVEAHEPSDASDNGPLDGGWSGHHVCKDYGQVQRYLEGQIRSGVRTVLPIDD